MQRDESIPQRVQWIQRVMMVLTRGPMFLSSTARFPVISWKRPLSEPYLSSITNSTFVTVVILLEGHTPHPDRRWDSRDYISLTREMNIRMICKQHLHDPLSRFMNERSIRLDHHPRCTWHSTTRHYPSVPNLQLQGNLPGFGDRSISTRHIRQLPAIFSLS